jgi:DNA-binding NarL/FixJ family response regulator
MPPVKRIFLVEDHPIFRMGMTELLNADPGLSVCGEAEDLAAARRLIGAQAPDLVIVDIGLNKDNGLELVKELAREHPNLPVLVLSMFDERLWAERALRAGARGYLMKQETSNTVVAAVHAILAGGRYVSPTVMGHILGQFQRGLLEEGDAPAPLQLLSDRELEVFRLIGLGLETREIAAALHLSIKTIGTYRERLKEKLGFATGAELVRAAVLWTANRQEPSASPSV